jgi:FMN phosphatase YigB (HAD superfamily)
VVFDLGRVLVGLDFTRGLIGRLAGGSGPITDQRLQRALADPLFGDFSTGRIAPAEFHRRMEARFGLGLGFEEFSRQWCDIFLVMPGMEALVREVAVPVPIGLLSDTDPLHWAFELEAQPWLRIFPRPTLSFEIGRLKPDPECFRLAADSTGVAIERCLFVDDLERNVEGARAAGMQAMRFEGEARLRVRLCELGVLVDAR